MQVILHSRSLFARPGSAPIGGGKKGEFRDWTKKRKKPTSNEQKKRLFDSGELGWAESKNPTQLQRTT